MKQKKHSKSWKRQETEWFVSMLNQILGQMEFLNSEYIRYRNDLLKLSPKDAAKFPGRG